MQSATEDRFLEEQKRKLEDAERHRKQRESELQKEGKITGHGIDDNVLKEMRERALRNANQDS